MSLKSKLLIILSVLLLFSIVVMYVFEFQWFQNYVRPKGMVLGSVMLGIIIGSILAFHFQKNEEEWVDKVRIWTFCLVASTLPMPLFASLTNRLFAERKTHEMKVEFWAEKADKTQAFGQIKGEVTEIRGHYIFVVLDGEIIRLKSSEPRFPNAVQGDTVAIPVRQGLWGVDLIEWQDD